MSGFESTRRIAWLLFVVAFLAAPVPWVSAARGEDTPDTDLTAIPPGTLAPADVIEALSPLRGTRIRSRGTRIQERSAQLPVFFAPNSAELTPEARTALQIVAAALAAPELAGLSFQIVGHSDQLGSAEKNQRLSKTRAEVVRYFLIAHGVPEQRLAVLARGESEPIAPGQTPTERERNRRIEVVSLAGEPRP